ncbi:hypothetical protein [Streptomyces sp. NPDC017529]|uniref:hypothetical protein n=1 Tax=Streptomyces sp. NPDC017529 TaxID=3365000 RepID=UPI0037AD983E
MDEYAGRVLAERYRLPVPPSDEYEFAETRAFDTYSGQEVLVRQVPLPEVVEAELLDGRQAGRPAPDGRVPGVPGADRTPHDPAVRRALEAATAAARLPDHPQLDQVFDVFAQDGSLWIVSERVAARPLAALLAERPLSPHRAAEVAADVLTALRALHAHGWTHRNITVRTVLICDDGRAILTGLAAGAAQEALCGYDPVPGETGDRRAAVPAQTRTADPAPPPAPATDQAPEPDARRARAGAIAAYQAGTRAAAARTSAEDTRTAGQGTGSAPEHPAPAAPPAPSVPPARPGAALAAERARQLRISVIGPVTERWAPEQAGPVHANWQLAPPVGPATDLWAVGALLFRIVQGHPAYPEDSAAELVQLVCSEPPSYAEDCGALRPVVESLMRQDPADRPDFEELRGWLRSLIRTAPEPEAGSRVVTVPSIEGPADSRRLPILRRRGELVRKGRHKKARQSRPARPAKPPRQPKGKRRTVAHGEAAVHGHPGLAEAPAPFRPEQLGEPKRPRRFRETQPIPTPDPTDHRQPPLHHTAPPPPAHTPARPPKPGRASRQPRPAKQIRRLQGATPPGGRGPRHLGRLLVGLVFLLLVAAILYAALFLPKSGSGGGDASSVRERTGAVGAQSPAPDGTSGDRPGSQGPSARQPQTTEPAGLAEGFAVRKDPKGFQVAVRKGWERRGENERGQVRYLGDDFELLIVPGRDATSRFGGDPMAYMQDKEAELAPYRESSWSGASGLRRVDVGRSAMAEGTFTWQDSSGRQVYVRNLAMIHNGRYHVVQVIGPDNDRREVDRLYDQATGTYRPN